MWHACKQRTFSLFGLQNYSSKRNPFGVFDKKEHNVKPRVQETLKSVACYPFTGQGTERNWQDTCDDRSHNRYRLLHCQWLETLSWVGTALALGLNYKFCSETRNRTEVKNEFKQESCFCKATDLLLRLALSMPKKKLLETRNNVLPLRKLPLSDDGTSKCSPPLRCLPGGSTSAVEASSQALEDTTRNYFAEIENLAGLELMKMDKSKAFAHFLVASDLGSTKGHFNVGVCYETGQGTEVDFRKACHHYGLASDAGHSLAAYNLGLYFMEGRDGVEKQLDKGLEFLKKASDLNVGDAQYYLGVCYQEGWAVQPDIEMAMQFFGKAASLGHQGAIDAVADLRKDLLAGDGDVMFTLEPSTENPFSYFVPEGNLDVDIDEKSRDFAPTFHTSASSPELCIDSVSSSLPSKSLESYEIAISRYLDVILPYRWIPEQSEELTSTLKGVEVIPNLPTNKVMTLCLGM